MASPQCENGYTKVANELLEALARIRIPGEAMQVFLVIVRKTYGYQKKEDAIALSQFSLATGLLKSHICESLRKLKMMNLITEIGSGIAKIYSINKDFSVWKSLPKKVKPLPNSVKKTKESQQTQGKVGDKPITEIGNDLQTVTENGKNLYRIQLPQKKKENIYSPNSIEIRMSELLLNLIRQRNPNFKQPDLQRWAKYIDLMLRIDKRSPEEIERVITWCQADAFWQNNILSTEKLRKQYDQLCLKMTNGNGKHVSERQRYY